MCSGRVSSSCSTCGTRCITLAINPVKKGRDYDYNKRNISVVIIDRDISLLRSNSSRENSTPLPNLNSSRVNCRPLSRLYSSMVNHRPLPRSNSSRDNSRPLPRLNSSGIKHRLRSRLRSSNCRIMLRLNSSSYFFLICRIQKKTIINQTMDDDSRQGP